MTEGPRRTIYAMFAVALLMFAPVAPVAAAQGAEPSAELATEMPETLDEIVAKDSAAIASAFDAWAADKSNKLKEYTSENGRILLVSDFSGGMVKDALKRSEKMLVRLDRALGAPAEGEDTLLRGVMIQRTATYHALCDALADASPPQRAYFQGAKDWTGLTIYAPELTVYFHDPSIQDEARADHNVGHNLAHLEVHRRYGVMPLWIAEAIATACEDGAWGEVWAPWNLSGFVYAVSHADWRGKQTRSLALATEEDGFGLLWGYTAKPFREEEAKLAFAFATYGLDRDPVGLGIFLQRLQREYSVPDEYGVRKDPTPEDYEAWMVESFGGIFPEDFRSWWKKPPSWKAKPKVRDAEGRSLPPKPSAPEPTE